MNPILKFTITIALIIVATYFYTMLSIYFFMESPRPGKKFSFWGTDSWVRKYKHGGGSPINTFIQPSPGNWYYKFFKIPYREAFPGSATIFVMFTDGYHLCQWFFIKCIIAAIAINTKAPILIFFLLWAVWCVSFSFYLKQLRNVRD